MKTLLTPPEAIAALDVIADTFDEAFTYSVVGRAQRDSVWREMDRCFQPGQRVIEIECSTGYDTSYLAARGVEVWACESSLRMLELARKRISTSSPRAPVHLWPSTEGFSCLREKGPFDGVLSNFGRLNCVEDVAAVGRELAGVLKPGATVVLCLAGKCVPWEIMLFLWRRRFRDAFRRFRRGPVYVKLAEGMDVACWYPSVRALRRALRPRFNLVRWSGIGVAVPPTYLENRAKMHPRTMNFLKKIDPWFGNIPLVRAMADHVLLVFEKAA